MGVWKNVRMRCAFRYLFCLLVLILTFISIHLALISDKTAYFLKQNFLSQRKHLDSALDGDKSYNANNLSKLLGLSVKTFLASGGARRLPVAISWQEYRSNPTALTGNPLIDDYGKNDPGKMGENGSGIILVGAEKEKATRLISKYNVNVYASDRIPLNRLVPDARFAGCDVIPYPSSLPTTSIIIPFYDEWPSILLRTIYSIVNRTPRHLLQEIILVDDGSQMGELKGDLDKYIESHFPKGLVKMIRVPERRGLIQARLAGYDNSTGDVIIFFDSHMEVNIDWLQPLLVEIKKDRTTIAMGNLDYIQLDSMEYKYYQDYMTRYGFDWRLVFFETFFRNDQVGAKNTDTRPGTVMVGAAYAIERNFFAEMGKYDEGMKVWGGENLEMAWRIWLCGGKLVHVPCSHIGHVARSQPYTFPGGREAIEQYNYKRAIEVWMEQEHKDLVYNYFPQMAAVDVGDLSERLELKKKLKCKPFSWFMDNVWQELFVLSRNVTAWGSARNLHTNKCLDNHQYLFQAAEPLFVEPCHYMYAAQGFSLTKDKLLRTSLQCVVLKEQFDGARPKLEDCIIGPRDTWIHQQGGFIKHEHSKLCLDLDDQGPVMKTCDPTAITQIWQFNTYIP
ncbi:polypeptide N-acetylgalactosaminyltransferase 13-like [Ruditapes philippinarum]|uniref:polypeptide N-acetylgalactosaminyltransferase 13-like n=1 Tax=Ruditapes philippinarum TaxID=129788 RepID=UPI00295B2A4A|nr:polypeptide N-acetylgalactosaminyltransferase 13-like [Ruditapes philippinarum]XP_060581407.1 polypeptide N-acetylgalactosaminyltransferase 13-like [Ruditapes philippinarum]XP_060581408.1 polypeptide N-acetylgalactosaminyltransferase 13-like [Ruditapes philippinarum]